MPPGENGGGGLFRPPLFAILFNLVDPIDIYLLRVLVLYMDFHLCIIYGVLYFLATLIHVFHILLALSSLTVPAPSSSAPAMKGAPVQILGTYLPYRSSNIPVVVVGVEAAINTTARPLQYGFRFYGHP